MLIEKEVIGPGTYWYVDQDTNIPRKLDTTPELTHYWHEQGNKMLSSGLTIPVPYEHDFDAHPMTPKDKLLNNAGWVKEYRLHDGKGNKGDKLHAIVDIQDPEVAKKLPNTIRWTSPWINSFTDGEGRQWNNVISHLALTTRPRITNQAPFPSIAAALSMATSVPINKDTVTSPKGFFLSRAGRLVRRKSDKRICPLFPIAFSLISGAAFAEGDNFPPKKDKSKKPPPGGDASGGDGGGESDFEEMDGTDVPGGEEGAGDESSNIDLPPLGDKAGDVSMEEVLCDLLRALGVNCEHDGDEQQFKRNLYMAAMKKVHELTNKGMNKETETQPGQISKEKPPGSPGAQQNPLIQQEQQPMYMSLDEINKISDPVMKNIALAMYNENVKLRAEMEANQKTANSLRDAKLKEATAARQSRISFLSRVLPKVKGDLEAMLAMPNMALSMGDGGEVVDPMSQTLAMLEKGLSDMPKLLTTDASAVLAHAHPTDAEMTITAEEEAKLVDSFARMMGATPEKKAS